jgi:hypothetical protein
MLKAFSFRPKDILPDCYTFNAVSELVSVLCLRAGQMPFSNGVSEKTGSVVKFPVMRYDFLLSSRQGCPYGSTPTL